MIESIKKTTDRKLVDTNVILRYLLRDEPSHYEKAKDLFEKVRTGEEKIIILESVIVESVYILTKFYNVPKQVASEKLKNLLHYKGIANSDKNELSVALTLYSENNIDFVDCILCEKAKFNNYSLFTFDKKLKRLTDSGREAR